MTNFGKRLSNILSDKGLSAKKLSEISGISTGNISSMLKEGNPKLETILKIADGLKLSNEERNYLVFGKELKSEDDKLTTIQNQLTEISRKLEAHIEKSDSDRVKKIKPKINSRTS